MPIESVFCNVPWKEVHINADGTYHSCGAQPNRVSGTPDAEQYNVFNMTIPEWINSQHQCSSRVNKLNGQEEPLCSMCYTEEKLNNSSKRIRENLKSGINTVSFLKDFITSSDFDMFEHSLTHNGRTDNTRPESYHISLGNECNLACRMCGPTYSSRIAVEQISNGLYTGAARQNWTENDRAWNHVIEYICSTDNLKFVHIIGGEPLLNPRFNDLVDRLLIAGRTDIYLGFTTNGTVFDHDLITKLNAFRHVDIGISVECFGTLNDLIRRGSNFDNVLHNIDLYLKYRKEGHVYVTLRNVLSALSVHTIDDLYRWCLSRQLDVMTNLLTTPAHMQIAQLPFEIKQRLQKQFQAWEFSNPVPGYSNPRDPNRYREHIDNEIRTIIRALEQDNDSSLTKILYNNLETWGWFEDSEIRKYFF